MTLAQTQQNVCDLISAGKLDEARMATDKMKADFVNNKDLPEAVYWVIRHYEWASKFDEAKRLYQIIAEKYPNDVRSNQSLIGITRCDAMELVISNDFTSAKAAADKMAIDFSNHPDLAESLYMVAEKFEWQWQFKEEKYVYQKIIQNHPQSLFADKAKIGMARADVLSYIVVKDYERVDKGIDILFSNFANNPELAQTALIIGEWFNREGVKKENAGLKDEAKVQFEKAVKVCDRVINQLPDSNLIHEAYYCAGSCYLKLGEYLKAAEAFGDSYQANPQYMYADYCLFAQADCYEKAKEKQTDTGITVEQIKEIYRELITKFPKSKYSFNAALRLDELQNENE